MTIETLLSQVAQAVEGAKVVHGTVWSARELYFVLVSKLKGVAADWVMSIHEGVTVQEKTYNRLKTMPRQRFGRQGSEMEVMAQVMTRMKKKEKTYAEYAAALRRLGAGANIKDDWYANTFIRGVGMTARASLLLR